MNARTRLTSPPPKHWLPQSRHINIAGQHVAIIGAGIAGATVAAKLAAQGIMVSVFEAEAEVATQASGNLAGNCLPVIDKNTHSPYARWHWQAWQETYQWWTKQNAPYQYGNLNGAAKWSTSDKTQTQWQQWATQLNQPDKVQWRASLPNQTTQAGLWFPQGGHLIPKRIIKHLLTHQNIHVHLNTVINQIRARSNGWQLNSTSAQYTSDAIIIATGAQTGRLLPEWQDTLFPNKGQVSHIDVAAWRQAPMHALSYGGYATPAVDGITCVGATFEQVEPLGLTTTGHTHNLNLLSQAYPNALKADTTAIGGHAAYRANTLDHLPLIGPVIHVPDYKARIAPHCRHPDQINESHDLLLPNLWFSIGHGAHGLTSAFLAAEVLCAQMLGNTLPISQSLQWAIHPARAIFRQLVHTK